MRIGIDPVIDYAFKKIFGTEGNKESLKKLINAIMERRRRKKDRRDRAIESV